MSDTIARTNMIKQQLRTGDVLDDNILELFNTLPRDQFVPLHLKEFAYSDCQLPLGHNQRMMTPLEEGKILQALQLKGHETVLEVGTGTGYLSALLSGLSRHVISIDYFAEFTANAKQRAVAHQCHNMEFITGNAVGGWADKAPFDVIVFTGGIAAVTEMHLLQLAPQGKLFAVVGHPPTMQAYLFQAKENHQWHKTLCFETELPALITDHHENSFVF